jgi:heat shock protein HslJ
VEGSLRPNVGTIRSRDVLFAIVLAVSIPSLSPAEAGAGLAGSEWRAKEIDGVELPPEIEMFIRFGDEGRLEGHGGRNGFFGLYAVLGTRIEIGPLGATRMACPGPVMEDELRFFDALQKAEHFTRRTTELVLTDKAETVLIRLSQTDAD